MRAEPRMHNIRTKYEKVRKNVEFVRRWTGNVTNGNSQVGRASNCTASALQIWNDLLEQFSRVDYPGRFPDFRKMSFVASNQIPGARFLCAFQKNVVAGVDRYLETFLRNGESSRTAYQCKRF